jgi:outer membrane receptor for monomeric catechols
MRKLSVFGVLLLLLATMSIAMAQTARTTTLQMNAVSGSKVTGKAVLTEAGTGVKVSVTLSGFDPNTSHDGHIHVGTCEKQGGVVAPLGTIKADAQGSGTVDSTVTNFTFAQVSDGNHYVQYHTSSNPPGPQVSCANIPAAAAAGQGGGTPGAPATGIGGSSQSESFSVALLAGLLVGLVGAGAGYRVARNRSK